MKALVIEDDPDIGRLITLQLAELDCESRLIADGVTAITPIGARHRCRAACTLPTASS